MMIMRNNNYSIEDYALPISMMIFCSLGAIIGIFFFPTANIIFPIVIGIIIGFLIGIFIVISKYKN